ncbi:hypothetical protein [Synechococcus sp. PCC 7335]|uniref:hypothetical protein n=1 Tax=Synechococcus sp. (strain ATCC 29403 / PCC 7335) TaxID=91464 RepID=UPI0008FED1CE|nr:hypothetical protein [Synechococcus sp. PCC 7335]
MQRPRPTKRSIYRRRRRSLKRSLGHSILSAGLAAVLGGTGVWITEALIAPQASQAYTSRLDLFLAREAEENYEALVHRAEIAAKSGAQRSFNDDLLTTIVSINVVVESEGITIPILALQVNREQWRSHPETYFWAAYYPTAKTLLNASLTISRR